MNEFNPGAYSGRQEPSKGRRGFLRGVVAGAVGLYVGNKYLEKEKQVNEFAERFEGKEKSYSVASEASLLLITEMTMSNIDSIRLSGTGHANDRVEILRTYLFRHLTTKGIGDKYSIQKEILEHGVFTKENLQAINQEAGMLLVRTHEEKSVPPKRSGVEI